LDALIDLVDRLPDEADSLRLVPTLVGWRLSQFSERLMQIVTSAKHVVLNRISRAEAKDTETGCCEDSTNK